MFRRAFTLIELLVVVAIIALLVSILLPNINCAREQAKAAKCGATLRSFGLGMNTYATEHDDAIVGVNSTGLTFEVQYAAPGMNTVERRKLLRNPKTPLARWDWITPTLQYGASLTGNRAERQRTIFTDFGCPSAQLIQITEIWGSGLAASPDRADFEAFPWPSYRPGSYLSSGNMQVWGLDHAGERFNGVSPILARGSGGPWNTRNDSFKGRLNQVGNASDKVFAGDGTRFLATNRGTLDFDPDPLGFYSSFSDGGPMFTPSVAYGPRSNTLAWDGNNVGSGSASDGLNLALSYRHGCNFSSVATEMTANKGTMNALFFDGHVSRMTDKDSRNINRWYSKGTKVTKNDPDLAEKLPAGFEVP